MKSRRGVKSASSGRREEDLDGDFLSAKAHDLSLDDNGSMRLDTSIISPSRKCRDAINCGHRGAFLVSIAIMSPRMPTRHYFRLGT